MGVSNYFGDLNTRLDISRPGLSLGVIAKRNFNNRVSLRGGIHYSRVSGDDADSPNNFERNRNLSFRSSIVQGSIVSEFNFFPHVHGSADYGNTPYMLAGIGVLGYSPTAELDGDRYRLRPLGTEGQAQSRPYNLVSGAWIVGGGWKMDVGATTTLSIELQYHSLWTDYLDDVSSVFPNPVLLESDIARAFSNRSLDPDSTFTGKQRGDSKNQDVYTTISVTLVKYWGRLECPTVSQW